MTKDDHADQAAGGAGAERQRGRLFPGLHLVFGVAAEVNPDFRGTSPPWRKIGETRAAEQVFSTSRLRLEKHTRVVDGLTIKDWLWLDFPDQVNALVQSGPAGKFLLFNQTKYGLTGTSLAPIGGYVEPGETPLQAVAREILEETGLDSCIFHDLGTFRVDVNRGCGSVSSFLALGCRKSDLSAPSDDLERQKWVWLDEFELSRALLDPWQSGFKEVKW
eukprot:CAMPEP_0114540640 /NCGR_PEP_ID=MMETSP0114-20121206/883_1 /TAXON_ID=31324 /ORGANISM="Goniomonas sp, Strain m" /LENGTH=218 /DNA_ID=CAMNT_0001724831 /DNA_START=32 /DNA_END=687 /DNA_ORIENTATION=+